ncbi:hypothetical protein GCM10010129_81460 [Streptomyces fumigatiscleroticus]|nr:hypothetical protein GCM10010129_81460 [Streptomyces fumigatiscleroticus]
MSTIKGKLHDAVALVRSSGKTVTEVAREIGVSAEGLRNWVKQDTIDRGQGAPGELTSAEREELGRLRRQNCPSPRSVESVSAGEVGVYGVQATDVHA